MNTVVAMLGVTIAGSLMVGPGCTTESQDAFENKKTLMVTLKDKQFTLELALTAEQRYQGLSGRKSIPEDGGMLFAFSEPDELSFVMRDCLVPIDIMFINSKGVVVAAHEMTVEPANTPEYELTHYPSRWPAQFVIELKGGSLRKLGLGKGDKVGLPFEDLKKRAD